MDRHNTYKSTCAQVLACLAFNCMSINLGMILNMPVIIIGALRNDEPPMQFSEEQASWFGGLIFITQPVASLLSGVLQDKLGRKKCMMAVNFPMIVAWLLIYKASCVTTLFIAVAMLGLCIGFMEAPVFSYIGEITEPRLRGVLGCFGLIFVYTGMMLESIIAAFVDWRTMALIDAAIPVVAFLALAFVPESPAWLVAQGRIADAQKTFQWLRGWVRPEDVREELNHLVTYVQSRGNDPQMISLKQYDPFLVSQGTSQNPPDSKLKIFLHHSVQRPLRLLVMYFVISTCSSLSSMRPYFLEFLEKLKLPIDSLWILVITSCLNLLGALTSTFIFRRLGKRGGTFISLVLCVACCFGLGTYLGLAVYVPWIPLTLFAVSSYCAPLGIMSIPWILISELFPLRGRGVATGVLGGLAYVIIFLGVKTYYTLVSLLTVAGACFFYGVVGLLGFVYLYIYMPETEGKTLEDIEQIFAHRRRVK